MACASVGTTVGMRHKVLAQACSMQVLVCSYNAFQSGLAGLSFSA